MAIPLRKIIGGVYGDMAFAAVVAWFKGVSLQEGKV